MPFRDLVAEDDGKFRGLPNRPVRIEEPLAEGIQGGATLKDQVVAVLDLREK